MDPDTAKAILSHHDGLRSWPQPFSFSTPQGDVDLSVAIGESAQTPNNVGDFQPTEYPVWPYHQPVYRFDPRYYFGADAQKSLVFDLRKSLVGVNYFANNVNERKLYTAIRLVCSFSKVLGKNTLYRDKCFMKIGTPVEPIKVRGSSTFDRLGNVKLKRNNKKKKKKNGTQKFR